MNMLNNQLKLNKSLYDRMSILEGIKDYACVCNMKMVEEKEYYLCTIEQEKAPLEQVKKEFCNYIIGLGVKSKRCLLL